MIIYLTTIEAKDNKFVVESKFQDMAFYDITFLPERAVILGQHQVKMINFFRRR